MSRPRPILLGTHALGLSDGEYGDVADTCGHLLSRLAARGLHVDVVTEGKAERVERPDGFGPAMECTSSMLPNAEAIAARKDALVRTTAAGPVGEFCRGIARSSGARFVVGYHAAVEWSLRRRWAASCGMEPADANISRLLDSFYESANLVLAPTRAAQDALAARLKAPVAVLGRGVDAGAFHPDFRRNLPRHRAVKVGMKPEEAGGVIPRQRELVREGLTGRNLQKNVVRRASRRNVHSMEVQIGRPIEIVVETDRNLIASALPCAGRAPAR